MKIKISPSLLETWRVVSEGLYGAEIDRLIDKIEGKYIPNAAASRGAAFHEMIEHGPEKYLHRIDDRTSEDDVGTFPCEFHVYEPEFDKTWIFQEGAVLPIVNLRTEFPDMVYETWGEPLTFNIEGFDIVMNHRLDGLNGGELHEFKTTKRTPKYIDVWHFLKWKCYLLALPDCPSITYHYFQLKEDNSYASYSRFKIERYPGLEQAVLSPLTDLVVWLKGQPELISKLQI